MTLLSPAEAWAFVQSTPDALFVDIRMEIEYLYVGHPPGVVHIAWYEYPDMHPDPARFVEQVRREAGGTQRPVVLICRSGNRTTAAAQALADAGFAQVIQVAHGFEGDLDADDHRGRLNGWRYDGLPWQQM